MRTIKEEAVTLHDDADIHEAYQGIGRSLEHVDQHKRRHSAWGYLTPVECEAQGHEQQTAVASMKRVTP
jgi:hypothetical protein